MEGPNTLELDESNQLFPQSGILPRTAVFIFEELQRKKRAREDVQLSVSSIEIYNDTVRDLLNSTSKDMLTFVTAPDKKSTIL